MRTSRTPRPSGESDGERLGREVDDAAGRERSSVIDHDDNGPPGVHVGHRHLRAERDPRAGSREPRPRRVVPRGQPTAPHDLAGIRCGMAGLAGPDRRTTSTAGLTTRSPITDLDSSRPFTLTIRSVTNASPAMPCGDDVDLTDRQGRRPQRARRERDGTTELARQDLDAIDDDRRTDVKRGAGRWSDAVMHTGSDPHGREEFPGGSSVGEHVVDLPSHDGSHAHHRRGSDVVRGGRSPGELRRDPRDGSAARTFHRPDPHTCEHLADRDVRRERRVRDGERTRRMRRRTHHHGHAVGERRSPTAAPPGRSRRGSMPSSSRSSRTFSEFVLIASARPPTTNVTCVREATNHTPPMSERLTANVVAWIARWIRNLRTRVGRTANLPPLDRGRLQGEAAWPDRSHHVHGP